MQGIDPILEKCQLFDGIRPEDLGSMLGCLGGRMVDVKRGQTVFQEGESAIYVGIVLSGGVQLIRDDYYGNRSIVSHISAAELFGESYAFSGAKVLPVTVQADADSRILLIDSRRIRTCCCNACDFHNRLIENLLRLVANKNLMLHQKIHITSQRTTREKLMAYLLQQAKLQGSNAFSIPYDRQALADYLEVDRSGLSVEIGKLRREGVIECEKNQFRLL